MRGVLGLSSGLPFRQIDQGQYTSLKRLTMNDENKSKDKLIKELTDLRQRIKELEGSKTDRKRAEEELRDRREMISAFVETSREWIWSIDLQGVHTYSNPAIEKILGYPPDDLIGKPSFHLMHDEDRRMVEQKFPKWIAEKSGWKNLLIRWRHKDGDWRYLESNAVPILNAQGDLVGFRE